MNTPTAFSPAIPMVIAPCIWLFVLVTGPSSKKSIAPTAVNKTSSTPAENPSCTFLPVKTARSSASIDFPCSGAASASGRIEPSIFKTTKVGHLSIALPTTVSLTSSIPFSTWKALHFAFKLPREKLLCTSPSRKTTWTLSSSSLIALLGQAKSLASFLLRHLLVSRFSTSPPTAASRLFTQSSSASTTGNDRISLQNTTTTKKLLSTQLATEATLK